MYDKASYPSSVTYYIDISLYFFLYIWGKGTEDRWRNQIQYSCSGLGSIVKTLILACLYVLTVCLSFLRINLPNTFLLKIVLFKNQSYSCINGFNGSDLG